MIKLLMLVCHVSSLSKIDHSLLPAPDSRTVFPRTQTYQLSHLCQCSVKNKKNSYLL